MDMPRYPQRNRTGLGTRAIRLGGIYVTISGLWIIGSYYLIRTAWSSQPPDAADMLLPGLVLILCSAAWGMSLFVRLWREREEGEQLRLMQLQDAHDGLMQRFFELPFVGIAFASGDGRRWISCNDRACEILGRNREQLRRTPWHSLLRADDAASMQRVLERMARQEIDADSRECRLQRSGGGEVVVELDLKCVRRGDGSVEMFIVTIDDISGDVAAREALVASERRLQQTIVESPHPTIVLAEDGEILLLSRSWCEASGIDCQPLRRIDEWLALTQAPERIAPIRALIQSLFDAHERVREGEFRLRHSDGFQRIWMFSSAPLGAGPDGRRQIVTTAVDVTERRRLERVLEESNALYLQMFNDNPICMYVWDAETRELLAVNDAAAETYGWKREELLGRHIEELRPDSEVDRLREVLDRLPRTAVQKPGVWTHRHRDGHTFQVEISLHAMRFGSREAWLTMAVDVSDRERARSEIETYVRRLEAATASTFSVISSMVELRDPYTGGHERRVGELAAAIAAEMGLDAHVQKGLRLCGAVHDVGKIGVPAEILAKPSRLSPAEYNLVMQHASLGYEILKSIDLPWPIAEVARQHHERIDGSGYPQGLKGDGILLEARIVAVADVVESMASHRPYRPSIGLERALVEIERGRGTAYDGEVVAACLRLFRERDYALPV